MEHRQCESGITAPLCLSQRGVLSLESAKLGCTPLLNDIQTTLAFGEDGVLSDESELKVTLTDDSLEVAEEVAEKVNEALTDELTDELTEVA